MRVSNQTNVIRHQETGHSSSTSTSSLRSTDSHKIMAGSTPVNQGSEDQQQALSGGTAFSDPMADADTLMRAIIDNLPGKAEQKKEQGAAEQKSLAKITEQFQGRFAENASDKEAFHELMQNRYSCHSSERRSLR